MDHSQHNEHGHDGHHDMNNLESLVSSTVASVLDSLNSGHNIHESMDHGMEGHDHSMAGDMDHSGLDHGSLYHRDHAGMGHNMKMWFHAGYSETILFESWKINSIEGLIGSFVGIFLMATIYEGLKYYRQYLYWRTDNAVQYRSVTIPTEENQFVRPTLFSWIHAFQTSLHLIQIVLSYFLMLIFMTYNVWLCIAVVMGAVTGYFLFGWKKPIVVDVTEHCH